MSAAQSPVGRARLLTVASPHSGDFLNATPCSSVGTRLDSSFRIATALRLGAPICAPHQCVCGENVDQYGVHGLSCRRSAGRHSRHSAVNDLIKRALTVAEIPARLKPTCLSRNDRKSPDGLTGAMVTRQVLGVGLHMSRHSGHKLPTSSINNCRLYSRR